MTWRELFSFLRKLEKVDDPRLDDRVIVYDIATGDTNPCDVMETNEKDNPITSDNQLVLMMYDWGQMSELESPTATIE